LVRVERLELLLLRSVDLDHQVQVLQLCGHLNFTSNHCIQLCFISLLWHHLLLLGVEWHHVGEGFSVIFDEGRACEHKFGIYVVVFNQHLSDVHSFELDRAICIQFDAVQIGFPFEALLFVFLALLCDLDIEVLGFLIKWLQIFVVELAVNFVKLVLDCQEHHPPTSNWEVVVLANDLSRLEEVFLVVFEEFQVCLQIVVLNPQFTLMWLLDLTEQINRFLLSVLKLQIVGEAQFVCIRVGFLLSHRGQEVVVSAAELLVKNSVGAFSAHFVCAAVDHRVVLKVLGETRNRVALVKRNQ